MSHRHHSHLAAICPFDSGHIPEDVVKKSVHSWIKYGMGAWAGWSIPWAAMIHTRQGNSEMANLLLSIWPKIYTNKGGRTLHDPVFPGFSSTSLVGTRQVMQMDAGMGIAAAILDSFLYEKQGILELLKGIPQETACRCKNISAPGGLLFSASRTDFSFTATRPSKLHFRFPQGDWKSCEKIYHGGEEFEAELVAGTTIQWERN